METFLVETFIWVDEDVSDVVVTEVLDDVVVRSVTILSLVGAARKSVIFMP